MGPNQGVTMTSASSWSPGTGLRLLRGRDSKEAPESQDVNIDADEGDGIPIQLLGEPRTLGLSDRDMEALLEATANPLPPNEAMLRAMKRWREHGSLM
jgi:hypothetical protein